MAFELTPTTAGTSLIVMGIVYAIMAVFSLYQLYLNWRQSQVKNLTEQVVIQIKENNIILTDIKNMLVIINDQATETKNILKKATEKE